MNILEVPNQVNDSIFGVPAHLWGAEAWEVAERLSYGSYVSRKNKYVYVEVPKAACTRLKSMIHKLEGLPPINVSLLDQYETRPYMLIHARNAFAMPSLCNLPRREAEEIMTGGEYTRFCFVRNPYSRVVSVWKNKVYFVEPGYEAYLSLAQQVCPEEFDGEFLGFRGFVRLLHARRDIVEKNAHLRPQTELVFPDAISYDVLGRLETFDEDIRRIESLLGFEFPEVENESLINASPPGDWRGLYDEELASIVHEIYRSDFEYFGYDQDSWRGGNPPDRKSARERYLEEEIYQRNRMIANLYAELRRRAAVKR